MRQKNNYTPFANAITAADYGMQCDAATVIPLRYDMYAYLFNDNDEKQLFLWIHVYTTNKASNWRSALLLVCERNTQMTNEFRSQWSVMRSEMRKCITIPWPLLGLAGCHCSHRRRHLQLNGPSEHNTLGRCRGNFGFNVALVKICSFTFTVTLIISIITPTDVYNNSSNSSKNIQCTKRL